MYFMQQHHEFRVPELLSLSRLFGLELSFPEGKDLSVFDREDVAPFLVVRFPSEEAARKISSRAILIRGVFEIWGRGSTYEQAVSMARRFNADKVFPPDVLPKRTFKCYLTG